MTVVADIPKQLRIGSYDVRLATRADNPELARLYAKASMAGTIRLAFERPDPWETSRLQAPEPHTWIATHPRSGEVVATYCCSPREIYVNGTATWIPYLGDLRIAPGARNGVLLLRGFQHLETTELRPPAFAQTLILQQNAPAMALLTSGRAGLPTYYRAGEYSHFALHVPSRIRHDSNGIRTATAADIPAMQALYDDEAPTRQFRPRYRFSELGASYFAGLTIDDFVCMWDGDEILGFAALWDLRAMRRTRIVDYSPWLRRLRPVYNMAWGRWRGDSLPAPGTLVRESTVTALTCRDDDRDVARRLLAALLNRAAARGLAVIYLGLASVDPLIPVVSGLRRRNFPGQHYLVSFGPDPRPALDDRPFYIEAARI